LTAHSNALSNGTSLTPIHLPSDIILGVMILGTGLLLRQTDIIQLSPLQSTIVVAGLSTAWLSVLSECANSYWYVLLSHSSFSHSMTFHPRRYVTNPFFFLLGARTNTFPSLRRTQEPTVLNRGRNPSWPTHTSQRRL
jgi:hypothetical protein